MFPTKFHQTSLAPRELNSMQRQVLILSEDQCYSDSMRLLLESSLKYFVCQISEHENYRQFLKVVNSGVVILEFDSNMLSFTALRNELKALKLAPKLLLILNDQQMHFIPQILEIGTEAIITKGDDLHRLVQIIDIVNSGHSYLSQKVINYLVKKSVKDGHSELTQREYEVLVLLGKGLSYNA
ncbi:response regulator transcription factor, partial [Fulvivirga lutimaris]|uniref:response regulator transcription factor n=1 Tax=Fulvivirga lutimaris TaxID=1819566 RepID=UPI001629637F